MIAPRHLPHAPIREALIDIQVTLPDEVNVGDLDNGYEKFSAEYPRRLDILHGDVHLNIDEAGQDATKFKRTLLGFRYESGDGSRIAQFRTNGFTFSKIGNYTNWQELRDEARKLWEIFVEAAKPETVTRVATRYINELLLPEPVNDFGRFLTAPPIIPPGLPQTMNSFLTRLVLVDNDIPAVGVVTQALKSHAINGQVPILLDIDVFNGNEHDVDAAKYWDCLESLRIYKNKIFFESITEETAGLFE